MRRIVLVLLLGTTLGIGQLFSISFPYDKDLAQISDATLALTVASPVLLVLAAPVDDYLALGASYTGTMVTSYAVRSLLKHTIERERPYVDDETRPDDTSEDYESFPSGHALLAFSAAAYTQTISRLWYPDSKLMQYTSVAGWTLATVTAVLRVASGSHYLSDVVAGAAIGSAFGFLGPYLTNRLLAHDRNAPTVLLGPTVGMQVSF